MFKGLALEVGRWELGVEAIQPHPSFLRMKHFKEYVSGTVISTG